MKCTFPGCKCKANLTKLGIQRHMVLAHGVTKKVERGNAEISYDGVIGAYEVSGKNVLRCEGEIDGVRCSNHTDSTCLDAKVRCETCAPGKSHACPCGTRNLTCDVKRLRHKFRQHGEERPLDAIVDGFIVIKGIYVDGVLGAYVIKEDVRFQRTVRVLRCEGVRQGVRCSSIAGRSQDKEPALCVACDPLTVPTYLVKHAKGHQKERAKIMKEAGEEVPEDFHEIIEPQALLDKWNANKNCVHCGQETVLSADVELYGALSMDRPNGGNYTNPLISCWPCNNMMKDYDKDVVTYAVTTGQMPLHEQREDFVAYQLALLKQNRRKDLDKPKYRELENWATLKQELCDTVTTLEIPEVDELTGQRYCNCPRKNCPLRVSFDRIDSDLPHVLSNLQPVLACTNRFKSTMPDHDFRLLIAAFREHNRGLTVVPQLTEAPTEKKCKCGITPLDQFSKMTKKYDGLYSICKSCRAAELRGKKRSYAEKTYKVKKRASKKRKT